MQEPKDMGDATEFGDRVCPDCNQQVPRIHRCAVDTLAAINAELNGLDWEPPMRRGGATLSIDKRYRYRLWRELHATPVPRIVTFVMLNPSTADALVDDQTIRKCVGFARGWGFERLEVVNLFAWRARNPKLLPSVEEPIGSENDSTILERCLASEWVIAAWGADKFARSRAQTVTRMLTGAGVHLRCLRKSKDGNPWHPLYVPYASMPITFADAR